MIECAGLATEPEVAEEPLRPNLLRTDTAEKPQRQPKFPQALDLHIVDIR